MYYQDKKPKNKNYSKGNNYNQSEREDFLKKHPIQEKWIVKGDYDGLVSFAEAAGKTLADEELTNSQIRNVYGEIKRIQMVGFENAKQSFYLLKPKVAYAYGRDKKQLATFKKIFDAAFDMVNGDAKAFKHFCDFMEAILAYHRANCKK